jgi:hypothetical protein
MFLKLAPISESYDMFIALAFCYVPVLIWFYFAWRASKSGSFVKTKNDLGYVVWVPSEKNVPFHETAQFYMGLLWFFFGSLFFWLLLWPDHSDVWFIN